MVSLFAPVLSVSYMSTIAFRQKRYDTVAAMIGRAFWKKCRPAITRHWLWLLAGILWSGVGIMLCSMAAYWLSELNWPTNGWGALAGFGSGIVIYRYGFSKIAMKNIRRIEQKPDRVCLFAFQAWKSYLLIAVMMLLGYVLRHSSLPRLIIAVVYSGIGTGLTLSSSLYYQKFF